MKLQQYSTLTGHKDVVWNLAWSPDGDFLASCGGDKRIYIWGREGENWVVKTVLEDGHERTVRRVSWSPDGKFLASGSFDATTCIWERKHGAFESIATLEGHENEVKGVAWDAAGALLATCSRDKSVWIWEMEADSEFECIAVLHGHTQDVKSVLWHPSQEALFSCSYDDTIKIWLDDEDDWYCARTLAGHTSTVWDMAFNRDGSRLVSCSDDRSVIIWDTSNFKAEQPTRLCTLTGSHQRCIYSVDWNSDGVIATGAADDAVRIYSQAAEPGPDGLPSYRLEQTVERAHGGDVNCVRWNPVDHCILATASDDGVVKLWRLQAED